MTSCPFTGHFFRYRHFALVSIVNKSMLWGHDLVNALWNAEEKVDQPEVREEDSEEREALRLDETLAFT